VESWDGEEEDEVQSLGLCALCAYTLAYRIGRIECTNGIILSISTVSDPSNHGITFISNQNIPYSAHKIPFSANHLPSMYSYFPKPSSKPTPIIPSPPSSKTTPLQTTHLYSPHNSPYLPISRFHGKHPSSHHRLNLTPRL